MMTTEVMILPTENNDVDGNAKDSFGNDVDHDDDNYENGFFHRI